MMARLGRLFAVLTPRGKKTCARQRVEAGLTLIELLVTVAVVALLTSLVVPRVLAAMETSRQAQVLEDLRVIQAALERHYTDYGYYPRRLGLLITRGYLRANTTFKSPVSGYWYFYAVDDNREDTFPQAYVLGAPGRDAGPPHQLFRSGPLPRGRNPGHTALAWMYYGRGKGVALFTEDGHPLPDDEIPATLATYRTSCQSGSTERCDLLSN